MGLYSYRAKDIYGKNRSGKLEAADSAELIAKLKAQNLFCYDYTDETQVEKLWLKKLGSDDLVSFCRQLATMLSAGVTLVRALKIIYSAATKARVRNVFTSVYSEVNKGSSLSEAMLSLGGVFPEFLVHMVETGENSGSLDAIMLNMARHYENERKILNKVKTAMIYPSLLGIVSVISVAYMIIGVLPQFASLFENVSLPASTRFLLGVNSFVKQRYPIILTLIIAALAAAAFICSMPSVKLWGDRLMLRLPIVGRLNRTIYTSRFASAFHSLYSGGIGMLSCLEISAGVLNNQYIKNSLYKVGEKIKTGEMLSGALEQTGIFDPLFVSMIITGEEAGALDEMLLSAGAYFSEEADSALTRLIALIEPGMIILLALIIGFIVISIMLPIFTMYGQII